MSRYVLGFVNFADIARLPPGSEAVLMLNPEEPSARQRVSASLKAACVRAGQACRLDSQNAMVELDDGSWRKTHLLYVRIL